MAYTGAKLSGDFCIHFVVILLSWRWRLQAPTKRWCIYCPIFRVVQYAENRGSELLASERQKSKPSVQTSDLVASSSSIHGWSTNHWITSAIFFRDIMLKSTFLLQKGTETFPSTSARTGYKLIVSNRRLMVSRKNYFTSSYDGENNFLFIINRRLMVSRKNYFTSSYYGENNFSFIINRRLMVSRKNYFTSSYYGENNFSFIINITYLLTYLLHEAESF
jgi:hypothetical protein